MGLNEIRAERRVGWRAACVLLAALPMIAFTGCSGGNGPAREDVEDALNRWSAILNRALNRPPVHLEVGPEQCSEHEDGEYLCAIEVLNGSGTILPDLNHLPIRRVNDQWTVEAPN